MRLTDWTNINMSADKTEAEITVSGYIGIPEWWQADEEYADKVISTKEKMNNELSKLANLGVNVINLKIDSYGGDVNHGISMRNALVKSNATIKVEYIGWSASAATIIGTAGKKENVSAASNMMILVHEARGITYGTKETIESYAKTLEKINKMAAKMYAEQTGKTEAEMAELMAKDGGEGEWLTAAEAQEIGLIGEVYEPLAAAAFVDEQIENARLSGYSIPESKIQLLTKKGQMFGKKKTDDLPLNTIQLGESMAIFEGEEIAEGMEVKAVGGADIEGEHILEDGRVVTIEANVIKSIVEGEQTPEETISADEVSEMISEATAPILEALEALKNSIAGLSSGKKPSKKQAVKNSVVDPAMESTRKIHEAQRKKYNEMRGRK